MVAMTTGNAEEPILCRMERLDNMLRQLEEIRGCNNSNNTRASHSPKSSSFASTPSRTSDGVGHVSSSAELISPESLEKHCRPMEHVMMETDVKGTLIERLDHGEDRVLKLCMQLEEELTESAEKKRDEEEIMKRSEREEKIIIDEIGKSQDQVKKKKKKGLKQLMNQLIGEGVNQAREHKRQSRDAFVGFSKDWASGGGGSGTRGEGGCGG
ncbi:unnamed protein product, partial [Prunus brigantina]